MKRFKTLLIELNACEDAREWANEKTIEEVVKTVERGDWLLWLAQKIDLPIKELTLAKALCAKTVIHLMTDERSRKAVEVAEQFGLGNATIEELNTSASYAASDAAYYSAAAFAAYAAACAAASDAAYAAACAAAYSACAAAYYASACAAAYYASASAGKTNQQETAEICRNILGNLIIEKVNYLLLNTNK